MEKENLSKKKLAISSFLDIAIGQSRETAVQFLKCTRWKLDEALQLFYAANEDSGILPSSSSSNTLPRETPLSVYERHNADDEVSTNSYSVPTKIRDDVKEGKDVSLAGITSMLDAKGSKRSLTTANDGLIPEEEQHTEKGEEEEQKEKDEEDDVVGEEVESTGPSGKPRYPPLPEEPKEETGHVCRVRIRLPDGRRVLRKFLLTDRIQFLWSFCVELLEEAATRPFHFMEAIPGVSMKKLEYDNSLSFDELGLSNTMLSMVWD